MQLIILFHEQDNLFAGKRVLSSFRIECVETKNILISLQA